MSQRFTGQILFTMTDGLAGMMTHALFERHPGLIDQFDGATGSFESGEKSESDAGCASKEPPRVSEFLTLSAPPPFVRWKENFIGRIRDLAGAMDVGIPALFTEQWAWAKSAYQARGVTTEDLDWMLEAMQRVLERELPSSAQAEIRPYLDGAREALARAQPAMAASGAGTCRGHQRLAMEYLCALLEGDRERAKGLILGAIDATRLAPVDALLVVLPEAQREIGKLWHQNESTIAEEHFVTATTQGLISLIGARLPRKTGPERHGRCVLIAAVEGNHHDLGLRIMTELMEADGWRAILLGIDLPPDEIADASAYFDADLVALSAMLTSHVPALLETVRAIRERASIPARPKILVGGGVVPAIRDFHREVDADAAVTSIADALSTGRSLVGLPVPV